MAYGGRDDNIFRGAILQSGGAFPLTGPDTPAFQATFDSLITNTSCAFLANASASAKLDCIRNLPVEVFREKVGKSTGQAIDGDFTRTSIQLALPKGEYLKVPTIVGSKKSSARGNVMRQLTKLSEHRRRHNLRANWYQLDRRIVRSCL